MVNPGVGVQPLVAFEPLPDPVLTAEGSESEGSSGFALSPSQFPAGLNHGVFIGFHGVFNSGGTPNDENPVVFADPSTGHYFDFVSNNLSNIGHIDEILSTSDSLFLADIASGGNMGSGAGQGVIYQIQVITGSSVNHPPVLAPIADQTVDEGTNLTVQASATDPDANQTITYSLAAGAPSGASIGPQSGLFTWTPNAYSGSGTYSITVVATDNGSPPLSDSTSFTVNVLPVNHPPNFLSIPAQIVERTQPLQVKVRDFVSDPDVPAQTLSYSLAPGAPQGASIDSTGLFTWTPSDATQITVYSIGVIVTDNGSPPLSASQTFTVNVVPFNHPPVARADTHPVSRRRQPVDSRRDRDRSGPARADAQLCPGPGAPAGAAIGTLSGAFTWVPDPYSGSGTYSVTVIVTDNGSHSQERLDHVHDQRPAPSIIRRYSRRSPPSTAQPKQIAPARRGSIRLRSRSAGADIQLCPRRRCSLRCEHRPGLGPVHLEVALERAYRLVPDRRDRDRQRLAPAQRDDEHHRQRR